MAVKLGKTYTDEITGFTGTATARFEYLNGCVRYELEAPGKESSEPVAAIFDEQRLTVTPKAKTGGSRRRPPRTGTSS